MKNKKMIQFVKEVNVSDGITNLSYGTQEVEMNATKAYHNTLMLMYRIPDNAKNLMHFLIEKMTDDNLVHSNSYTRDSFNNSIFNSWFGFYKNESKDKDSEFFGMNPRTLANEKKYRDSTINTAFSILKKNGLLISVTRGVYIVNPEYFFKSTESKRIKKIKMTMELENGIDLVKIKAEAR